MSADLAKDPVFKRYATTVDRALAVFDTLLEWPDYIAFLGRLLKVESKLWYSDRSRPFNLILHVALFLQKWPSPVDCLSVSIRHYRQVYIRRHSKYTHLSFLRRAYVDFIRKG